MTVPSGPEPEKNKARTAVAPGTFHISFPVFPSVGFSHFNAKFVGRNDLPSLHIFKIKSA